MRHRSDPPTLDELRTLAAEHGIDRIGVTPAERLTRTLDDLRTRRDAGLDGGMSFTYRNPERSTDPSRVLPSARTIIAAARSYDTDVDPSSGHGYPARVARYAWTDHYEGLRSGLRAVVARLKASGCKAVALADDNAMVDREVAYRAGLGWYGKNANLLVHGAGSFFVLGSVITNAVITGDASGDDAPGRPPRHGDATRRQQVAVAVRNAGASELDPPEATGCGSCRRCIDACPTGAIVADGVIDANRCLAWILQRPGSIPVELRAAVGDRLYGCDDCQTACPPTVRLGRRHRRQVDERHLEPWVDALALLEADDATLLERYGRWYIADRDPRWLRRNALVVLGNVGDADDRRCIAMLHRYRLHEDRILAEAATWALDRLASTVDCS